MKPLERLRHLLETHGVYEQSVALNAPAFAREFGGWNGDPTGFMDVAGEDFKIGDMFQFSIERPAEKRLMTKG